MHKAFIGIRGRCAIDAIHIDFDTMLTSYQSRHLGRPSERILEELTKGIVTQMTVLS